MGFYLTDTCFFTNQIVISNQETDGKYLDGYYYRIEYNGHIREFKLNPLCNWHDNEWLIAWGKEFLEIIDKNNDWNFFDEVRCLDDIKTKFYNYKKQNQFG